MKSIKFTEKYLDNFFQYNFIEDDNLFECLKGREGTIEETDETFSNEKETHCIINIKLKMKEM